MAAVDTPVQDLCEEATCPICLEYFKDPVIVIECGHNFCRACLRQCWGEKDTEASCPQCRKTIQQKDIRPNRQLANVAEIAKKLSLQERKRAEDKGSVCEKHQEPLKLFCKDHESPICVVCDRSKEHENHKVVPLEEASQEYKDLIHQHLENLREEREKILAYKADARKETQFLLKQTKAEREKTAAAFRQLHQFLDEQEKHLLSQMEELEKEIARKGVEHLTRLSEELFTLESIIWEMEKKQQQPASEVLQDIRSLLLRYEEKEKFENPVVFSPVLKLKIWDFRYINPFLDSIMKQFKDTLVSGVHVQKANVTLDPDTAHSELNLSEDRKCVTWAGGFQDLPNNPERFDFYPFVLGCHGFAAGKHFWEVTVGSKGAWAVGVARKSVRRKAGVLFSSRQEIWTVGKLNGTYKAWGPSHSFRLSLKGELKRIQVSLNYEGGQVAFIDADTRALVYTYSAVPFSGETLFPIFYVFDEGCLTLSP
ncbi:zinc finger protein RFP-like [Elgaria multicarinata webbii]|uniref:zinc finger protein RFP-like n=1 Tax=Elgaria multicarinata webbii TaxID=159646 RepID=UPI002FCD578B